MQPEFWHARWQRNEIGFHNAEVHPALPTYWRRLGLPPESTVFVPLCGKSLDLLWLRTQGHRVIGVELSAIAVHAFFDEAGLTPTSRQEAGFEVLEADGITLYCGDFFALPGASLRGCAAVYDRAALIALPPDLRTRYAGHLCRRLSPATEMLLVTLEYPQQERAGPPFSVPAEEVARHYGAYAAIRQLERQDVLDSHSHMRAQGVTALAETVLALHFHD